MSDTILNISKSSKKQLFFINLSVFDENRRDFRRGGNLINKTDFKKFKFDGRMVKKYEEVQVWRKNDQKMTLSLFDYLTVKIYFVTHIFSRFSFNIFEVETMFAK